MEVNETVNVSGTPFTESYFNYVPKWAEIVVLVYMSLVTLFGVPGNGIILIVQWKIRDKSSTDILVTTMAVFELLCSSLNSIFIILSYIDTIWVATGSATSCSIHAFTMYITSISSTLLLTAIALDRYFQTCKPLNTFYSKKKATQICIGIIVTTFVLSLPGLFLGTLDKSQPPCKRRTDIPFLLHVIDFSLGAIFFTMFIAVVFCYTNVALLLQRRHRNRSDLKLTQFADSKCMRNSTKPSIRSQKHYVPPFNNTIRPQNSEQNQESVFIVKNKGLNGDKNQSLVKEPVSNKNTEYSVDEIAKIHRERGKLVNRTTLIMFLITTIYVVSWALHWLSYAVASNDTINGAAFAYLTKNLYMVNCVTNPIFFITLSSKFREKAKLILCQN